MSAALVAFGGVILVGAVLDVFLVVLHLGGGTGFVGPRVVEAVWRVVRGVARRAPARRDRVLAFSGPLVLVSLVLAWGLLVTLGCALIFASTLGHGVQTSSGAPTPTGFAVAVYVAAMSLTTLGTGDLVPVTDATRLFMVAAAALGFAFLTLTMTYLLSVYGALLRRNAFAIDMHHRTGGTGDAAVYLARTSAGGDPSLLPSDLFRIAQELVRLYESHQLYPVLHYFRYPRHRYSLARVAYVALDAHALATTALDDEAHPLVARGGPTRAVGEAAYEVLAGLGATFLSPGRDAVPARAPDADEEARWRARYREARERLAAEGLRLAPGERGEEAYVASRRRWQPWVEAFAERLAYDLDVVLGRAPEDAPGTGAAEGSGEGTA